MRVFEIKACRWSDKSRRLACKLSAIRIIESGALVQFSTEHLISHTNRYSFHSSIENYILNVSPFMAWIRWHGLDAIHSALASNLSLELSSNYSSCSSKLDWIRSILNSIKTFLKWVFLKNYCSHQSVRRDFRFSVHFIPSFFKSLTSQMTFSI